MKEQALPRWTAFVFHVIMPSQAKSSKMRVLKLKKNIGFGKVEEYVIPHQTIIRTLMRPISRSGIADFGHMTRSNKFKRKQVVDNPL